MSCLNRAAAMVVVLYFLATASFAAAGDTAKGLEHLLALEPGERMKLLAKVLVKDKDFVSATRGAIMGNIVERGSLQAVESSDVICRVRAGLKGSTFTAVIKWVIDDGSMVKKGDKVIEFDASAHVEMLGKQKEVVAKAEAEQKRAADAFDRLKSENRIDVKLAEIDVRLAEIALNQYKFQDALQKETLAIQVERAALLVERIKLQWAPKLEKANDLLAAKKSIFNREQDRLREIEKDIANCVITAPRDGLVLYYMPKQAVIGGAGQMQIVAQGEPVRDGQKLLWISDLKRMAVNTRVMEGQIHKVRVGHAVSIRVDAFPGQIYAGKVTEIATTANHAEWLAAGKKVYKVIVAIDGENQRLKPGMSAQAAIILGDPPRIPASAVLGKGKDTFCYVLADKELHVRKITVGSSDGKLVEIRNGLQADAIILRDPSAVVARLKE